MRAEAIRAARLVAAPGCYPTSILLPLLPVLRAGLVDPATIVVSSMSGVSGAGRKEALAFLFAECNESVRAYSVPKHRHLSEIEQELSLAAGQDVVISFTPHLVPVTAGIATTTVAKVAAGFGGRGAGDGGDGAGLWRGSVRPAARPGRLPGHAERDALAIYRHRLEFRCRVPDVWYC